MRHFISIVENALDLTPYDGSGPLYHGTDMLSLYGIIAGNYLRQSIDQEHNHVRAGVSLTYDLKMAWSFARRSAEIFDSNHGDQQWHPPLTGAVIGLDADKLRSRYRLVNYWDEPEDDEKEVRVLAPKIENLSEFLTTISFIPSAVEEFAEHLTTDYGRMEHGGEKTLEGLRGLLKHPLFHPLR